MAPQSKNKGVNVINKFKKFFEKCKVVGDNVQFTHTCCGKPFGKYNITEEKQKEFFKLYSLALKNGADDFHITEVHKDVSPVIIDLDLKQDINHNSRYYTEKNIMKVISLYNKYLQKYLDINEDDLNAFVFEKKEPNIRKGKVHDGVHIMYPDICVLPEIQHVIRDDVIKRIMKKDYFKNIPHMNDLEKVFDRGIISDTNWCMYGSWKPGSSQYKLTNIYDYELDELELDADDYNNLPERLSIRKFTKEDALSLKDTVDRELLNERIKGLNFNTNSQKDKQTVKNSIQHELLSSNLIKSASNDVIEAVKNLMELLDPDRADDYYKWIQLGWCLHNIDNSLLDVWDEFSKNCSGKYKSGECAKRWNSFRNEGYGLGSLFHWAKTDNPSGFTEYRRNRLDVMLRQSVNGTPYDVATVMDELYSDQFKCASLKHKIWYEYQGHKWVQVDEGYTLQMKISTEIVNEYSALGARLFTQVGQSEGMEKEALLKKVGMVYKVIDRLKSTGFKRDVMTECRYLFYDKEFLEKIDENRDLLCFNNGVYDLENQMFRPGTPDDCLTLCTNIDYVQYDKNNKYVKQVMEYFKQVQPKKEMRDYVLNLLASYLQGHTPDEKFHIWTGSGCHAKDTPIMMADGTIKMVQDVVVGDKLMGDDSKARNVKELFRGHSQMYNIKQVKGDGYIVNEDHILSLKATQIGRCSWSETEHRYKLSWQERDERGIPRCRIKNFPIKYEGKQIYRRNVMYYDDKESAYKAAIEYRDEMYKNNNNLIRKGDVIDISVKEYMKIRSKIGSRNYYNYKVHVDFSKKRVDFDPYMIGYWLGDGASNGDGITSIDKEVIKYFEENLEQYGLKLKKTTGENSCTYLISTGTSYGGSGRNKLRNALKKYNLIKNKHIPYEYKCNDRETRMQLLAGLLDSDGTYQNNNNQFIITQKSERLIDDICYLARSLGFACYKKEFEAVCTNGKNGPVRGIYYRLNIVGSGIEHIPTLLERKQATPRVKNKDTSLTSFSVEYVRDDYFYGFELDGNHRYLMGDFIVTHNSNSKSKCIELASNSLGDYAGTLPIALLVQKRSAAGVASPDVARTKGKRFCVFQEPEEKDQIRVGLMKELTGGDTITARHLFQEPIEFKPQFKLLLTCNKLPHIPSNDGGTWRRLRVVKFGSKFKDNPDPNNPNEFPKDEYLSQKFETWKEAVMAILINRFKYYKKHGLEEPDEVTKFTKQYQADSDVYLEYINECINEHCSKTDYVTIRGMYSNFRSWFKSTYTDRKTPGFREFKTYVEGKYEKKIKKGHIYGIDFRGDEDDTPRQSSNLDDVDAM